jgi:hypothetical protein
MAASMTLAPRVSFELETSCARRTLLTARGQSAGNERTDRLHIPALRPRLKVTRWSLPPSCKRRLPCGV